MDILGYIGYAILIFLAVTWTIGVRRKLEASIFTSIGALFFLCSAIIVGVSGANKLHSWWIIPLGFIFTRLLARLYLFLEFNIPIISRLIKFVASIFANIVRIGISPEKIRRAQQIDAADVVDRLFGSKNKQLIEAVKRNEFQVVESLLADGADVNAIDNKGRKALGWAAYKGHTEIVKLLLENGADVNAETNEGTTALMLAAEKSHLEIAKLLLARNADINAKTIDNGQTALMTAAAESGHAAVIEFLLENGADVNAKNNKGATALLVATCTGDIEAVNILLKKGADVDASTDNGITALLVARKNGHADIEQLLEKAGAKE